MIGQVHNALPDVLIVHTSGSTNLDVLTQQHSRAGVFYPLQTFSLDREVDWSNTPLFVEAVNKGDLNILTVLANSLSQRCLSIRFSTATKFTFGSGFCL